jgi:hypothetical protein
LGVFVKTGVDVSEGSGVKVGNASIGVLSSAAAVSVKPAASIGSMVGSSVAASLGRLHACNTNMIMIVRYKIVFRLCIFRSLDNFENYIPNRSYFQHDADKRQGRLLKVALVY